MTGLIYDDLFLEHGELWHPENRQRLEAIIPHLRSRGWLERLIPLKFGPAAPEEVAWIHEPNYVETLREVCERGGEFLSPDTIATARTYDAAMLAAGGCMAAARAAVADSVKQYLCLVRPPGHHARPFCQMGFCFFNNAALAAEAALRAGLHRVAIVDFDVHHGNGTQEVFYHRRDVLYISIHQYPHYPLTGTVDEVGVEDGAGFTLNIPLPAGACDRHYQGAFCGVVMPALDAFQPQLIIASAGYDAHHSDTIAHMNLSIRAYHAMAAVLRDMAARHAQGRLVVVLEGGYNLQWLPLAVENTLRALEHQPPAEVADDPPAVHPSQAARVDEALEIAIETHTRRLGL